MASALDAQAAQEPIVDCHIHLFDQTRPQGAPYSGGSIHKEPATTARYRKLAAPLGIVGAIEIEASDWIEDNLWVLEVIEKDPMMVGTIGHLQPEKPEFKEYLDRYHKNRRFLGIRYGNIWGLSLIEQLKNPVFIEGMKLVADADMAMDTANPQPDLMDAVIRLHDKVPNLRIILDHVPAMMFRLQPGERAAADRSLMELAKRATVYAKLSTAMRMVNGKASTDPALYKPVLDHLCDIFGEDKVLFGSDWPNEVAVDNLPAIVKIARDYFAGKSKAAATKFFWKNSLAAYKWKPRAPGQPRG